MANVVKCDGGENLKKKKKKACPKKAKAKAHMLTVGVVLATPSNPGVPLLPQQQLEARSSSLWVNRTACDELTTTGESLSGPSANPPSVVIFGIGDSGTRAVRSLYHAGGVAMCDETNGAGDDWPTRLADECLDHLLEADRGEVSTAAFRKAPNRAFAKAVMAERRGSNESHWCAVRANRLTGAGDASPNAPWGYKGPRKIYMLPVIEEAWTSLNRTQLVLVARDPRDICSGDNQQQFKATKNHYGIKDKDMAACLEWWARVWSNVLPELGGQALSGSAASQLVVVRIEDLVLPEVQLALPLAECMVRAAIGRAPDMSSVITALYEMHAHGGSYGGGLDHVSGDVSLRRRVTVAATQSAAALRVMELLGYAPKRYGVTTPTSKRVLHEQSAQCSSQS